jgi:hydroxymethylbilane synthase
MSRASADAASVNDRFDVRLRIGTRRSRLALAQAEEVAYHLALLGAETEIVPMSTAGDRDRGAPFAGAAGRKGLFVGDIVGALVRGEVDVAVHSAKDLPSDDPNGVVVAAVPERADPFDVLVTREGELGPGVVGTSSLRRRAQLRRSRPDVTVVEIHGNVDTRLRALEAGRVDGLVLAAAGLARLGIAPAHATPLPLEELVPAPGQGALAIQARSEDHAVLSLVARLDDPRSRAAFEAERALVHRLGGGCALPLGAYAEQRDEGVRLLAVVLRPDGSELVWAQAEAPDAAMAAGEVADTLIAGGAAEILAAAASGPAEPGVDTGAARPGR